MLRRAQGPTLRQAAAARETAQVIRDLTQGQALQNPVGRVTSVRAFSIYIDTKREKVLDVELKEKP
jgi:hypothetical protein